MSEQKDSACIVCHTNLNIVPPAYNTLNDEVYPSPKCLTPPMRFPTCGHAMHIMCAIQLFKTSMKCPKCDYVASMEENVNMYNNIHAIRKACKKVETIDNNSGSIMTYKNWCGTCDAEYHP